MGERYPPRNRWRSKKTVESGIRACIRRGPTLNRECRGDAVVARMACGVRDLPRRRTVLLAVPICLVVGACGIFKSEPAVGKKEIQEAASTPPSPLSGVMAKPLVGTPISVKDPRTGTMVRLVAEREYDAASGRTCRRFRVLAPGRYKGRKEGLACKGPSGQWSLTKSIVNPNDLGGATPRSP